MYVRQVTSHSPPSQTCECYILPGTLILTQSGFLDNLINPWLWFVLVTFKKEKGGQYVPFGKLKQGSCLHFIIMLFDTLGSQAQNWWHFFCKLVYSDNKILRILLKVWNKAVYSYVGSNATAAKVMFMFG